MRTAIVLSFLLVSACAVRGSHVYSHEVDRGSDLEKELGYKVSVQDERDEKPSESFDKVMPIECAALKYVVKFHATVGSKLKDLFELDLTLNDANGILVQVPLSLRSQSNEGNEIDVEFLIKKDLIDQAVLYIRCAPSMLEHLSAGGGAVKFHTVPETSYTIRLGDYAPGYEPTETQRIAELRKRYPPMGLLAWHRNKSLSDDSDSTALTVAQKVFLEANFIGLSRAGLVTLLGPPDAEPSSSPNFVTYSFGYRRQFVVRRFHFDSKGSVEKVEKLPNQ